MAKKAVSTAAVTLDIEPPKKGKGKPTTLKEVTAAGDAGTPLFLTRPILGIALHPKNARTHDQQQIDELARAMLEFGYTQPVLVDEDGLLAGHGRIAALKQLYAAGKTIAFAGSGIPIPAGHVPFIDVSGMPKHKREAYVVWDNKSALKSGWDFDILSENFKGLAMMPDADLTLTGFAVSEIDELMKLDTNFAPTLDPQVTHKPVTQDQITAGNEKLVGKYSDAAQQTLLDVMCPHCAKEFAIERPK